MCAAADAIDPNKVKCPAGAHLYSKVSKAELLKLGEKLFSDSTLSSNGLSCNTCHSTDDLFNDSLATPFPHKVSLAKQRAGLDTIDADEFVQFCMLAPMAAETLAWESKELAALTVYVTDVKQKSFIKNRMMANPCAAKNPCAMKNPCDHKKPCSKW